MSVQGMGALPPYYTPRKLTPRDRDLIREIFRETSATRKELATAFGVSRDTIEKHSDRKRV